MDAGDRGRILRIREPDHCRAVHVHCRTVQAQHGPEPATGRVRFPVTALGHFWDRTLRLRTGCRPRGILRDATGDRRASWQTVYRRFAEWSAARVWAKLHRVILDELGACGEEELVLTDLAAAAGSSTRY